MTTDFRVAFGGDSHEIDLNTLITSLVGMSGVIQQIQMQIAPDARVDIKVRAPERGSFLIDLMLSAPNLLHQALSLFTRDNVGLLDNIVSVFANTINLKQHLGGEPPASVEPADDGLHLHIKNTHGQVFIINQPVYNIYNNTPAIDEQLGKAFAAVGQDKAVESVSIIGSNNQELAKVPEAQFEVMSRSRPAATPSTKRTIIKNDVMIRAHRLSFEDDLRWGFVYEGQKITAKITDALFIAAVEANERFAKGDLFKVDLSIVQELDSGVNDYLNKSFEVVRVIEHVSAPVQGVLFVR